MTPIVKWRLNGIEHGFKSRGYGRYAYGIPESFFYRTKKR